MGGVDSTFVDEQTIFYAYPYREICGSGAESDQFFNF